MSPERSEFPPNPARLIRQMLAGRLAAAQVTLAGDEIWLDDLCGERIERHTFIGVVGEPLADQALRWRRGGEDH